MKPKMMLVALGACAMFASMGSIAALSGSEKGYVEQLVHGDWVAIRSAAQSLYGNTNTEVLDVAAEVLLERYPYAAESRGAVDAMAWVCRALGASNNSRYRPILEQVEKDKSVHRKLREHCEQGAESLPRKVSNAYVAGTVNLAALRGESAAAPAAKRTIANTTSVTALSGIEKGYVDQLVHGDWVAIRSTAQSLSGNTNTEVLDIAAEVLLEKYPHAGESRDAVDAMAWVCRSLGESNNSRYRPILEQVEKDKSMHRKLREHCERGAESLPRKVSNAYVAGTVNLAALRGESARRGCGCAVNPRPHAP